MVWFLLWGAATFSHLEEENNPGRQKQKGLCIKLQNKLIADMFSGHSKHGSVLT
jgi:hypothetical protein